MEEKLAEQKSLRKLTQRASKREFITSCLMRLFPWFCQGLLPGNAMMAVLDLGNRLGLADARELV
jgi:hypothetical protein